MRLPTHVPALALAVIAAIAATPASAGSVHLADDRQAGAGLFANRLTGNVSGDVSGAGRLDARGNVIASVAATVPIGQGDLDLTVARLDTDGIARGAFSFAGTFFAGGANVDLGLTWIEVVGRVRVLEKPSVRLSVMAGGRVLATRIRASTTTISSTLDDTFVLPQVGAALEARVHPRSILYGLVKYGDSTSDGEGNYTLEVEGGLSHELPANDPDAIGWRLTAGARYLNLEALHRADRADRAAFDLVTVGPFLELTRVF
jgi:hypothetical protein